VAADPVSIWHVDGIAAWLLIASIGSAGCIVLASTFMMIIFDLSGLRQGFSRCARRDACQSFKTPLLYKIVRHPLMLGFLLAFWPRLR